MRFQGESASVPMPASPQDSGSESDIDQADNEVGSQVKAAADAFECPHCGKSLDRDTVMQGHQNFPQYRSADPGAAALVGDAQKIAGDIATAARSKAASD